jgi:hypothetical protein
MLLAARKQPMQVALIGDVRANLPALEAVLAHAARQDMAGIMPTWFASFNL